MIPFMKTLPLLALIPLTLSPVAATAASTAMPRAATSETADELTPAALLSAQVSEIAFSNSLSKEAKQKKISTALKVAVGSAVSGLTDPDEIVKVATDLAVACVKAVPAFAGTIEHAVVSLPALAKISGAAAAIQASVTQALQELNQVEAAQPAPSLSKAPTIPEFGGQTSDTVVSRFR